MNELNRRGFCCMAAGGLVFAARRGVASGGKRQAEADSPQSTRNDSPIWDLHCHFSGVSAKNVEQRAAQILEYADRMRIQRLVFFMGWPWSKYPKPDEVRRQNDQVLTVLKRWPDRLLGFAYLNAQYPDACLREIERCVEDGPMVGVKLWVAHKCNAAELDPIIRKCGELNALVYQHTWLKVTGNLPDESTPMNLAELAQRHPTVPIVCGHTGGDWTRGIRAIRQTKNVYAGIGGGDPSAGFVEMAVRELGAKRVLYGSDAGGRSFASQLAKVYGARLSQHDKRLILGGNLRRLLTPILQTKGVEI